MYCPEFGVLAHYLACMMQGIFSRMRTQWDTPIQYSMSLGNEELRVNDWLGKALRIEATGNLYCIACGDATPKRYGQGFCYTCFVESPLNSECIVRPELCRAHLGQGRDPAWEEAHHNQPHVVYLALSGGLKVGVTRDTQVPTRWIDQGATAAVILAKVPYRFLAGQIEVALKNHFGDKTHWQRMLRGEVPDLDLVKEHQRAIDLLPEDLKAYTATPGEITQPHFPILQPLTGIQSINLERTPILEGVLTGIRGQYLMIDQHKVINVRRYSGVEITWQAGEAQPVQGSLF